MALLLSKFLKPECIDLDLEGRRKKDVIRELAQVLSRGGDIRDTDALAREILEREKLSSTGLGGGIAIPHCMTDQVDETHIALGRKTGGMRFDAVDKRPVNLFLLLVGPEGDHTRHLQVLSKLARYLHDQAFCSRLLSASSPAEILTAFQEKEA